MCVHTSPFLKLTIGYGIVKNVNNAIHLIFLNVLKIVNNKQTSLFLVDVLVDPCPGAKYKFLLA